MKQSSPIAINQDQNKPNNIELPHNLEAEQQLLGALIKNNELIDRVSQNGLKGIHFFEPFHEEIFEKIIQMNNNGKSVTILFLKTLFESNENFDSDSYFVNLVANAAHSLVIKEVADRVMLFDDGMLVEENTPEEFFNNPKSDRTKLFLSQIL